MLWKAHALWLISQSGQTYGLWGYISRTRPTGCSVYGFSMESRTLRSTSYSRNASFSGNCADPTRTKWSLTEFSWNVPINSGHSAFLVLSSGPQPVPPRPRAHGMGLAGTMPIFPPPPRSWDPHHATGQSRVPGNLHGSPTPPTSMRTTSGLHQLEDQPRHQEHQTFQWDSIGNKTRKTMTIKR